MSHICTLEEYCPDCEIDYAKDLWTTYYAQYYHLTRAAVESITPDIIIPTLFLVAHYMEIWAKTISCNYGMGKGISIFSDDLKGHELLNLLDHLVKTVLDDDEFYSNEGRLNQIYNDLSFIIPLFSEDGISLSESMRYPISTKGKPTLGFCFSRYINNDCSSFPFNEIANILREILKLTYEVYDNIYSLRIQP